MNDATPVHASRKMSVLWNTSDWAAAIAALPVHDLLPCRTILVPRERVAHALRRELIRAGHVGALAGTRFVPIGAAAVEVLHAAGVVVSPGEDRLRRARMAGLLKTGLPLTYFPVDLVRTKLGWDEAFARTISDLEAAGLTPDDLEARDEGDGRLRDVAAIWRALDTSAGRSWTIHRFLAQAAAVLEEDSSRWPYHGPVLAAARGDTTFAEARFVRAIPGVTVGVLAVRPVRTHYLDRLAALFGTVARDAVTSATAPRCSDSERTILASYLFEPPAVLADRTRPRSAGPDGTVDIEEHAGVDEELEATADWVSREIVRGTPLEEIAVLVPSLDPLAGLLAERLSRLPWPVGRQPVHVAGGLRFVDTAAGARTLAVIRALRDHLNGEAVAAVLPSLRTVSADGRHLSHGAAMDLVWTLGTVGGSPAHLEGAFEWATRAQKRDGDLAEQLQRALDAVDDPEQAGLARQARELERLLADLRAIRPALEALVGVARRVVGGEPLAVLWPCLREFLQEWMLQPGSGPRAQILLDEALGTTATEAAFGSVAGEEALRLVEEIAAAIRLPEGRFGEPAVYIGTVRDAIGLPFQAVRIIGLAEGHLPALPREDPVIPDALRAKLVVAGLDGHAVGPSLATERSLAALHAFDAVVRNTTSRIALSTPRLDVERSLREPASVILEAAAALGRPNSATGAPGPDIPDTAALERDAFRPAYAAALQFRREWPVGESAWQDAVAWGACGAPPHWVGTAALDLERIAALREGARAGALDGILGPAAGVVPMPGLTPERPISPSKLKDLLQCPHLFLLGTLLGLDEPAGAPTQREIGQPAYGALLHLVAQAFYQAHGAAFCARDGDLDRWRADADVVVERVFGEFLEQYPLSGTAMRNKERERVRRDFYDWLAYDWQASGRRFVAVERAFGRPEPLDLTVGGPSLYVRGQIDRIDVDGSRTVIRDLKTARAHPRVGNESDPDPVLDVQFAVYALAVQQLATGWQLPAQVGGAYSYVNRGTDERDWRADFEQVLKPAAAQWLGLAADMLAARVFPRTPDPEDCTYCRFRPVCGDGYDRARQMLIGGDRVLERFGRLKQVEPDA
jgi:RecB family exonuclease